MGLARIESLTYCGHWPGMVNGSKKRIGDLQYGCQLEGQGRTQAGLGYCLLPGHSEGHWAGLLTVTVEQAGG